MAVVWPPALAELQDDVRGRRMAGEQLDIDLSDATQLQRMLDAAVAFVQRVRGEDFNFAADPLSALPAPDADLVLGTIRLAVRWHTRRRSPDALVLQAGELGTVRIPSFDPDIDRMLGIGRFAPMGFA